ncbi:aldo/keto reductase [Clostridium felsineum]|uniref:aldo/keto reductase n=1 Tax=Clostridium felsineum TaxID=36839 RepID=UPI00214D2B05|nr:aldo/keto reductase [Clostridium felsineum]MCR3761510.1 aldo/keto reductase [Clostridium felsineum]
MKQKKLGFGCMRLPLTNSKDQTSIDLPQFCKMIDTFLQKGFTYFDTAYMYHNYVSETMVREALVKRYPRDSYTITTKLPTMMLKTKDDMERIFNEQLEKCGVEYFDYYLLHCLNKANYAIAQKLDSFRFIEDKKNEGKIHKIGFSYHDNSELLDEILTAHPEVEFVQLQLNYLDWDNSNIQSRKCYEICKKHDKPVIVMEPIKGGMLAKVPEEVEKMFKSYASQLSVASWAIRFAATHENVMMVLSGMSSCEQLEDNVSYMENFKPLDEEEMNIIDKAVDTINSSIAIPCTACQYCVEGCPKRIPIPKYFELYNYFTQFGTVSNSLLHYKNFANNHGRASDCIACRQCESHCPQHLHIVDNLKKISAEFDK